MSVQYDLSPSSALLIPTSANIATAVLLERFTIRTSCHIRLTNTTNVAIDGIWLWAMYGPGATPSTKDVLLANCSILPYESIALDAGPFNFPQNGALFGRADTANVVAMHVSKAQY